MSELEDDTMTTEEWMAGIAVTLLQIRDYLYVVSSVMDKGLTAQVEAIHDRQGLLLDLPSYREDSPNEQQPDSE